MSFCSDKLLSHIFTLTSNVQFPYKQSVQHNIPASITKHAVRLITVDLLWVASWSWWVVIHFLLKIQEGGNLSHREKKATI